MFTKSTEKGFTLIELLVVIAIIGLLASTVLAALSTARVKARDTSRVQAVKELQKSLELYRNANSGNYPCATANPACAATGAAAVVEINSGVANNVIGSGGAVDQYFKPTTEGNMASINVYTVSPTTASVASSIMYRVGSTAGTNDSPDRNSYTILVRRELAAGVIPVNTWCTISSGAGHSAWTGQYSPCF